MRIIQLCLITLSSWAVASKKNYQTYLESTFGNHLSQDVNGIVQEYYDDLLTTLFDFNPLSKVTLTFQAIVGSNAVFIYHPDHSQYRLKQNATFAMEQTDAILTFQRVSGDCSGIYTYYTGYFDSHRTPWSGDGFRVTTTGDYVVIEMERSKVGYLVSYFVQIPDDCVLSVFQIQRRVAVELIGWTLRFALTTNQVARLKGLTLKELYGIRGYNFMSKFTR